MIQLLGLLICLLGIIGGLYLGVWVMFIGGIIQIIQNVTPIVIPLGIGLGILRIICSSFVGWLGFYVLLLIGCGLIATGENTRR